MSNNKIAEIQSQIEQGNFETNERIDGTVKKLLEILENPLNRIIE